MVNGTGPLGPIPQSPPVAMPPTTSPPLPAAAPPAPPAPEAESPPPSQYSGTRPSFTDAAPVDVNFGAVEKPPLVDDIRALRNTLKSTSSNHPDAFQPENTAQQAQHEKTAKTLGFANHKAMQYALRNLPPTQLDSFVTRLEQDALKLPPSQRNENNVAELAQTLLKQEADQALTRLFQKTEYPKPTFSPPDQWTAQGVLATYNAFAEIEQSQGTEIFKHLAHHEGRALNFQLDPGQVEFDSSHNEAIQVLTSAMMIAQSDHEVGTIRLHPSAISMSPDEVLAHPPVQALIEKVEQGDPEAVSSLQSLLNYSRPQSRAITTTGRLDPPTQRAVQEFQYQQVLMDISDAIGDDMSLPPQDKARFRNHANNLRTAIADHGTSYNTPHQVNNLLHRLGSYPKLSETIRDRLNTLQQELPQRTDGQFDRGDFKGMVENWYGMIDGGEQLSFNEQVITHELGHILQNKSEVLQNWRQISWGGKEARNHDPSSIMAETLPSDGHAGFASDYAQVNDQEDFAESYRLFTHQPERLLQANLMKFMLLSSITGKYEGKEDQMVHLIQSNGYDETDLERALLRMRGQLEAASRDNIDNIADTTVDWTKKLSPLVGMALEKADGYFELRHKIADAWTQFRGYQNGPNFTPGMASSLSRMDKLMGVETAHLGTRPHQPGFVLDFLSRNQTIISSPDSSREEKVQARVNLANFQRQGLDIFPEDVKAELCDSVNDRFQGPKAEEERAMALSLAYILGRSKARETMSGEGEKGLMDRVASLFVHTKPNTPVHNQRFHMNSLLNDIKRNPDLLKQAVGHRTFEQLPESFMTLLSEPQFLNSITSKDAHISANLVQDYVSEQVSTRSGATNKSTLATVFERVEKMFSKPYTRKVAYELYVNALTDYNQGVRQKIPVMSKPEFENAFQNAQNRVHALEQHHNAPALSQESFDPRLHQLLEQDANKLDIYLHEFQFNELPQEHHFGGAEATG